MIRTGLEGVSSIKNFYVQARMSKMASGTRFFCTDHINTLFKKSIKSSLRVFLVVVLVTLNKPLELSKKLFN
jgi:hypothetical protein